MRSRSISPTKWAGFPLCLAILTLAVSALLFPSSGQQAAPAQSDSATSVLEEGPTPAGAFLRGVLLPGWGHASTGSLTRGAFYFGVESATGWMLYKTIRRLDWAEQELVLIEADARATALASGLTDPTEIDEAVDENAEVIRARGLVEARESQREDWIAVGVFFLLLSGVDAFVSSHLKGFPEPLVIEGASNGERFEVQVSIPIPNR